MAENKENGMVYIGQTTQELGRRKTQHIHNSKRNKTNRYFSHALSFYGLSCFYWSPIDWAYSKNELNEREKWWIDYMLANNRDYGYNLTDGGESCIFNEETIKKMSEAKLGKPSHRKGSHCSEETKKKISISQTGKKLSPETREKMSKSRLNKRHTEDSKQKMRKPKSEEAKKNITAGIRKWHEENPGFNSGENHPFYGKHHSEETKQKISEKLKLIYTDKEKVPMYGKHHSEETKIKLSIASKGRKLSDKTKELIGKASIGRYQSDEKKEKCRLAALAQWERNKALGNKVLKKETNEA
ncbi:MAG: NUMOD3 domain-containing DNA-binding protein [Candidatus Nanoarchaeia archaeon]|nr:NUMOD3 domain-containing DNA-binding protein [Candidatus Nanoarchaeia archaeon]